MKFAIILLILMVTGSSAFAERPAKIDQGEGSYAQVGEQRFHYRISGKGPNLFLLHGGMSSSEDFLKVIPALSKHFRVITVDRMGHGRSSDSGESFTYAGMAEDMKAFLTTIGVRSTHVVGWSDGGIVGYHLASRFPGLVTKLVTMGANTRLEGISAETLEWIRARPTPESLLADLPEMAASYKRISPNPQRLSDFVRRSRELWLRDPYIGDAELKQIQAPVLLIAGDRHDIRVEHLLVVRASLREAQLCILPGASHAILQEKPQLLVTIFEDFLCPTGGCRRR
jgi:pimeloyl-ACP methyl ester carboxylesterase